MSTTNFLVVEGKDDCYAIAELMGKHVSWPIECPPVKIKDANGFENITKKGYISAQLKSPEVRSLGIIVDADEDADRCWRSIRNRLIEHIQTLPAQIPASGLISTCINGKKLGVWIMPDNSSKGMLETFLSSLIDDDKTNKALWEKAINSVDDALANGAPCSSSHTDKAYIHTWLAWQAPPGERFGTAIVRGIINPRHGMSKNFVSWFKSLYGL